MDSCIISLNLNCILQLKQFYNIASKGSCRKKCYYFWWSTWLLKSMFLSTWQLSRKHPYHLGHGLWRSKGVVWKNPKGVLWPQCTTLPGVSKLSRCIQWFFIDPGRYMSSRCVHSRCVHSRCVHSRCVHSRGIQGLQVCPPYKASMWVQAIQVCPCELMSSWCVQL